MRVFLTERAFRRALIVVALAGLFSGAAAWANGRSDLASWCWAAGTVPVVVGLLLSMIRDFWQAAWELIRLPLCQCPVPSCLVKT